MKFTGLEIPGSFLIDLEPFVDDRGFFARAWCADEFAAAGIDAAFVQANIGRNKHRGTLRGLHYQEAPHAEAKLVRCTRGAVYDVLVDLRPESPTYRAWFGSELSAENHRMLFVPEGCAHGYQSLTDDAEVYYQVSSRYAPGAERGIRYDDPAIGVRWPLPISNISPKDRAWPLLAT